MGELAHWTWIVAGLAASIGALMGTLSFLNPQWGASVVRLTSDNFKKGGWAEFRSSYGGALVLLHGAVVLTMAMSWQAGMGAAIGATFTAACYWLGMAIGRLVSMIVDAKRDTRTTYNGVGIGFELLMAFAMGAPFIAHIEPTPVY